MTTNIAKTTWTGGLDGSGTTSLESSKTASFEVRWGAREATVEKTTNPEELIAAAHATCLSMALSHALGEAGHKPERLEITSTIEFKPGVGITKDTLDVVGKVAGIEEDKFREVVEGAKAGCPVSQALAGVEIVLGKVELQG